MNTNSLRYRRAISLLLFVLYCFSVTDVYERNNGVDFWVLVWVFTPLHLLFALAESSWPKVKMALSVMAGLVLAGLAIVEFTYGWRSWFEGLATAYMVLIVALLGLAGLTLFRSDSQPQ